MQPHPDTRRVPGWQRVLDALVAAPDHTLTNAELGAIPGVQAFHQRLSDLARYGYVLTPAVKLAPGYYAYGLVGVMGGDNLRPDGKHHPGIPCIGSIFRSEMTADVVAAIKGNRDTLLARRLDGPDRAVRQVEQSRMVRDAIKSLQEAVGEQIPDEFDRSDLLVLAHTARDEIARLLTLQTLADFHADAWARVRAALAESGEVEDVADLGLHDLVTAAIAQCKRPLPVTGMGRRREPGDRPTGPALMRKALEHHEQPMHSAKIAEWVMANGGDAVYKGLTPAATMGAQLATSNKTDGEFVKTAPGCFGLREWAAKPGAAGPDGAAAQDEFGNELLDLDPIR